MITLVTFVEQQKRGVWRWRQGSFPPALVSGTVAAVLLAMLMGFAVRLHSMVGPLRVDNWVSRQLKARPLSVVSN